MIITISREFGSGGRELGKRLAEALHIPCYDHQIIELIAKENGLNAEGFIFDMHFCMDEMNPDYREVLYLTYFEDMSYAQAAEVTGKTVKQITNMVYRGKKSLRRLLELEGITNAEL